MKILNIIKQIFILRRLKLCVEIFFRGQNMSLFLLGLKIKLIIFIGIKNLFIPQNYVIKSTQDLHQKPLKYI